MKTTTETPAIAAEMLTELRNAAAATGRHGPEEARQAAQEVNRIREENRRKFGEQAIDVSIIREFRGLLPE